MTLEQLKEKENELLAAIQNEKIWMFGSTTIEDITMHSNNVDELRAELRETIKQIKELEANA